MTKVPYQNESMGRGLGTESKPQRILTENDLVITPCCNIFEVQAIVMVIFLFFFLIIIENTPDSVSLRNRFDIKTNIS